MKPWIPVVIRHPAMWLWSNVVTCMVIWSSGRELGCSRYSIMWLCVHQAMWSWSHVIMRSCGHEIMWSWDHVVIRSCGHEVMGLCGLRSYSHEFMWLRSWGHMVIWSCGHDSFGYEIMRSCGHEVKWYKRSRGLPYYSCSVPSSPSCLPPSSSSPC